MNLVHKIKLEGNYFWIFIILNHNKLDANLKTFIITLVGCGVTGLAAVAYKKPQLGRLICYISFSVIALANGIYGAYNTGRDRGLFDARRVAYQAQRDSLIASTEYRSVYEKVENEIEKLREQNDSRGSIFSQYCWVLMIAVGIIALFSKLLDKMPNASNNDLNRETE